MNFGQRRATVGMRCLGAAAVGEAFLLPLLVLPGIAHPFHAPKLYLLGGGVCLGLLGATACGLLRWPALPRGLEVALAVWLGALGASAVFGSAVSASALLLALFGAGWFLLLLLSRPRAERLARALVMGSAVLAALAVLQFAGLDFFQLFGWAALVGTSPRMRVYATLGNPNFVAAFLVGLVPITLALPQVLPAERAWWWAALLLQALALVATGSRGIVLGLGAALVWSALLGRTGQKAPRWRWLAVTAAAVTVVLLMTAPSRPLEKTLRGRAYLWRVSAAHLWEHPLFGFGPGAFELKYPEWEAAWWSQPHAGGAGEFAGAQDHAHNDYLEIALEHGFAGLAGWLVILGAFFWFAARCGPQPELVAGATAGAVALGAVALVDFPLHRPTELFVFWTLLAIAWLAGKSTGGER